MPDRIRDKKQLIIEETGCDAEQAELILTSTSHDVEKAIKIINSLLKQIVVLKGKFKSETANIYGLLILIADIKLNQVLRLANIITYNPSIYQVSLNSPWHEFERKLYALRLREGSLQELTQKLQNHIKHWLRSEKKDILFGALLKGNKEELARMLDEEVKMISEDERIRLNIELEEVNLFQFKELKEKIDEDISKMKLPSNLNKEGEVVSLVMKVEIVKSTSGKGKMVKDLQPRELVWAKITDQRDIAQYLAKLLGGRIKKVDSSEEVLPLNVPVESISENDGKMKVRLRFGPAILGEEELSANERISVIGSSGTISRLWKNLSKIFSLQK